jgi:DNA-directed RNA polymerase specialized sigma24 family protein
VHLSPVAAALTGLSAPPVFFRHGMAKQYGAGALIDRQGCSKPSMNDAEYRRLVKILAARACRALRLAASKGEDWILAEGKSPTDYAAETLILWSTNKLQFTGTPDKLMPFLTKVTTNAIVSALRKKETKASRSGKMLPPDELTGDDSLQSKPENLFDIRSLLRDDAFRKALDECTADDEELKEYVVAIETFEDIIPAAQDIASLVGAPVTNIYERRRKLARRLGKHGFTASRRRSRV